MLQNHRRNIDKCVFHFVMLEPVHCYSKKTNNLKVLLNIYMCWPSKKVLLNIYK